MSIKDRIKGFLSGIVLAVGEKVAAQWIEKYLTVENIKSALDAGLDVLENLAEKTKTKLDDKALAMVRKGLDIPDNDEAPK